MVEIDCEKSMKLETSRNVTKSKRSLHWCRSISKKYLCTFYYSISQKVITLSGRRFITVSGGFITLSGSYYSIGRLYYIIGQLLQYLAFITLSVGTPLITPGGMAGGGGVRGSQIQKSWEAVKRLDRLAPNVVHVCGFILEMDIG